MAANTNALISYKCIRNVLLSKGTSQLSVNRRLLMKDAPMNWTTRLKNGNTYLI